MAKREEQDVLFSKAKAIVYRFFKFRIRSEQEIITKLKDKAFDNAIIEPVIAFFKKAGLIDDAVFAKAWIVSRLAKPIGVRRIRQELKEKGVADEIVSEQVAKLTNDYDEFEAAQKISQKRMKIYQKLDETTQQRRLEGYLLRRGFSTQVVYKTLKLLQ
jgi:regulatory protein